MNGAPVNPRALGDEIPPPPTGQSKNSTGKSTDKATFEQEDQPHPRLPGAQIRWRIIE